VAGVVLVVNWSFSLGKCNALPRASHQVADIQECLYHPLPLAACPPLPLSTSLWPLAPSPTCATPVSPRDPAQAQRLWGWVGVRVTLSKEHRLCVSPTMLKGGS
jgi:hypothetical protein